VVPWRGCDIFVIGGIQASAGWFTEQPALTDPALSRTSGGPFQLKLFCHNMIFETGTGP